ncbi:MAG: efflux RND transporter periplasmic adaptor subunit [Flavobacteriales bacterium]|nr:efflux RND transporter periplasmic adaptor subunit [Flavobacteriales bacterium]
MAPWPAWWTPVVPALEADVPESYLQRVKVGDPVLVEFPSLGDSVNATLANVSRFIDPANRTFKVSVRVPNGSDLVRPNLLSLVHIRDLVQDSAMVVPSRCIQEDVEGNNYVFVLEHGRGEAPHHQKGDGEALDGLQAATPMATDGNGPLIGPPWWMKAPRAWAMDRK